MNSMKNKYLLLILLLLIMPYEALAQRQMKSLNIFDDRMHLKGLVDKYKDVPKEILLEMIKDETLTDFKTAAAINIFKNRYAEEVVTKEKKRAERILSRKIKNTRSPFVQVEAMAALIRIDRYKYFKPLIPAMISKLNHYNEVVYTLSFDNLSFLIENENTRAREAKIIFNTLRKMLFLSRNHLGNTSEIQTQLANKLTLLRWSIKTLGNESLKKLPKEILNLL